MGKSIKFLNNLLLDSSSIVHDKITLDDHFNSNVYQLQYATFLPDNTDLNTGIVYDSAKARNVFGDFKAKYNVEVAEGNIFVAGNEAINEMVKIEE